MSQGNAVCLGAFGKMSGSDCRRFLQLPHPLPASPQVFAHPRRSPAFSRPLFRPLVRSSPEKERKGNGCYAGYCKCRQGHCSFTFVTFISAGLTISKGKPRIESSLIMLFLLIFVLITLASASANNVSSKPCDNKVSSSIYGV